MEGSDGEILLDEIVCEIPEKFIQWRLTVNTFRGKEYLHLRKYFLDFDGDFVPTKEGACIPVDIQRLANLVSAMFKLLSNAEVVETVMEHLDEETLSRILKGIKEKR